jgi:hypothetical protein
MKPFQIIEEQKKVIEQLKYKLQFSKDKVKDAKTINTLINTVNGFDSMLKEKYFTDTIETFLYSIIKEWFMMRKVYDGSPIPLVEVCKDIDFDILNGSKQKKLEVLSILKMHELAHKVENKTVFDKNYTNFEKLLTNLINEFKVQILWNKSI